MNNTILFTCYNIILVTYYNIILFTSYNGVLFTCYNMKLFTCYNIILFTCYNTILFTCYNEILFLVLISDDHCIQLYIYPWSGSELKNKSKLKNLTKCSFRFGVIYRKTKKHRPHFSNYKKYKNINKNSGGDLPPPPLLSRKAGLMSMNMIHKIPMKG